MSEYEEKLDKVLYVIYRLRDRLPGRVRIEKVVKTVQHNHSEFSDSEIEKLLKGLEEHDCIERKLYMGGINKGEVTLVSWGIKNAEIYEKKMTPGTAKNRKRELENFLTACCEKVGFELIDGELNAYEIGEQLGFNREKTGQIYQQLKNDGYLAEHSIRTHNDTKSYVTTKGLNAVSGVLFEQPTGVTNVINKVEIGGNVNNSAIAAGDGNAQSLSITQEQRNGIEEFLSKARSGLVDLNLDADTESDYNSHLDVIEGTLVDDNPQPEVVKKELRGLKRIAKDVGIGAAGGAGGTGIVEAINALLPLLG